MSPTITITPFRTPACGVAQVPGSKSITNRALLLAALAEGETLLTGALFSRDTRILIVALQTLGFAVTADEAKHTIHIRGLGGQIPKLAASLHIGNAGTAARFLTAFLALAPGGTYTLDGDEAMRGRPMAGLLAALTTAGCRALRADGQPATHFPFTLHTTGKLGALVVDAAASSQLLSALLIVLPLSPGASVRMKGATVSAPFVTMTEKMCSQFGRPLQRDAHGAWQCAQPGAYRAPGVYAIEPDATAASYFIALPAVAGARSAVRLQGYATDGLQGDTAFAAVVARCGAILQPDNEALVVHAWTGFSGGDFNFSDFSDTFLTLATLAPLASSPTTIRDIGHTRKQETDRVLAMATELERLGVRVSPTAAALRADEKLATLTIYPSRDALLRMAACKPIEIQTYEDHRMAMSFGILGSYDLFGDGRPWIAIQDPACTDKTFPHFFAALEALRVPFVAVAIDGGAASGKSSTARAVAQELGFLHVDTGSHYRSITRALLDAGAVSTDERSVELALARLTLGSQIAGVSSRLTLAGQLPAEATLRTADVNTSVSVFAALPVVRSSLLAYQRSQLSLARAAGFAGVIMEGRDIGSVVLPSAAVRIFLEADPVARTQRRLTEGLADAIAQRDLLDSTRAAAPLVCPSGATRLDNTHLSLADVIATVRGLIHQAQGRT